MGLKSSLTRILTTIAAVLLVGSGESQQSAPAPETKPVEPVAETEKQDLTGKWLGKGYGCGPNNQNLDQEISITQNGNKVVAIKITGDDCIGAGQKTWEGIISGSQIKGSRYGKFPWVEKPSKYDDLDIRIKNNDLLVWDPGITFERIKISDD